MSRAPIRIRLPAAYVAGLAAAWLIFAGSSHAPEFLAGDYSIKWLERWLARNAGSPSAP